MEVTVPVGCTATVYVPADENRKITESGALVSNPEFIPEDKDGTGYYVVDVESGVYKFDVE